MSDVDRVVDGKKTDEICSGQGKGTAIGKGDGERLSYWDNWSYKYISYNLRGRTGQGIKYTWRDLKKNNQNLEY